MANQKLEPHKITKPIQLLGAWLVGLVLTDSIFLTTAAHLDSPIWGTGALIIAAIANVPLFLIAMFLLQTRFRAELQEDSYYSEYISKKTASVVRVNKDSAQDNRLSELERQLSVLQETLSSTYDRRPADRQEGEWHPWPVSLNSLHPQAEEIKSALKAAKIPVSTVFSPYDNKPPEKWIISINPAIPAALKAQLLRALLPFKFEGFELYTPVREIEEYEDVYIGGFGYGQYAKITPELHTLLEKEIDEGDLSLYSRIHRVTPEFPQPDTESAH